VKKDSVSDVVDFIKSSKKDTSFLLTAPYDYDAANFGENLNVLKLQVLQDLKSMEMLQELKIWKVLVLLLKKEWKLIW
jgi:hypothetical protein